MGQELFLIEAEELISKLENSNLRVYDATIVFPIGMSPEEAAKLPSAYQVYQSGHIPGAAFLDHEKFSNPDSPYDYMLAADEVLARQIGAHGISKESEVVVYTTGILACATRAWWILRYAGVENVRVLNGGFAAWREAGGAVETTERAYPATQFTPKFSPEMFANKEEVQSAIASKSTEIENALTLDWHNQEHIPGSSCYPLTDLTAGWETFLPANQIAAKLERTNQPERIITYCGGGIAATLNAMAHLIAGHRNIAVYDGSLFEWKGEGLPIETTN